MTEAVIPYGWKATSPNGLVSVFTGAQPLDGYTGVIELATEADYEAAVMAMRFPALSLADQKAAKLTALYGACAAAITGGFTSSALGSVHTYPSAMTDQQNLLASVTASLLPSLPADWSTPFWCADATGAWAFVPHTVVQIQQAGQDGKAAVLASQAKLEGLRQQVGAVTASVALNSITWE